jgi:hypothetical protein
VTLLRSENSVKSKAANTHAKTTIREEVHCCDKKLVANPEQKKGAIAAFFQPVRIIFRELLDLRLREGERIERYAKTTKQFLECAVPDHFIDLHHSSLRRRSQNIAIPALEIAIDVSEEVGSFAKRFQTVRGIQHYRFISGKKQKTVIHHRTDTEELYSLLNWTIVARPSPFSFSQKKRLLGYPSRSSENGRERWLCLAKVSRETSPAAPGRMKKSM